MLRGRPKGASQFFRRRNYFCELVESDAGAAGVDLGDQLSNAQLAAQYAIASSPTTTTTRCWTKAGAS